MGRFFVSHNRSISFIGVYKHVFKNNNFEYLFTLMHVVQDATSAASQLAASVIQSCAEKLQPFVCGFLTSCSLDRDAVGSELKEFYHEIVLKIFQCAPEMLNAVIPNLTQELMVQLPCILIWFYSLFILFK